MPLTKYYTVPSKIRRIFKIVTLMLKDRIRHILVEEPGPLIAFLIVTISFGYVFLEILLFCLLPKYVSPLQATVLENQYYRSAFVSIQYEASPGKMIETNAVSKGAKKGEVISIYSLPYFPSMVIYPGGFEKGIISVAFGALWISLPCVGIILNGIFSR